MDASDRSAATSGPAGERTGTRAWPGLALWLLLCYGASFVGSRFRPGPWYDALEKPPWTPPGWIFAPVWTVLYGMMAVAAWLVWKRLGVAGAPVALALFVGQLVANALWSYFFFGLERPGLAFGDIVLLVLLVAATLTAFWRIRTAAGALLIPYLLWVLFAAALNGAVWRLNA
jgi:tryptophan-rich sensory protein